jgi:hypothetical protein
VEIDRSNIFTEGDARPKHSRLLGCYYPIDCTGKNKQGCSNEVAVFDQQYCVQLKTGQGFYGEQKYLTAQTYIPAGTLLTAMGGVTVQEKTQPKAFASFTSLHKQQHDTQRADKF